MKRTQGIPRQANRARLSSADPVPRQAREHVELVAMNRALASVLIGCAVFASETAQSAPPNPPPTFGVPNTNPVPPDTSPVQLESCRLGTRGGELMAKTGDLEIQFTNEGAVAADLIRFRVKWSEDDTAYIRDQGKFSPGVTVTHKFKQSRGQLTSPLFSKPHIRCAIETVHFVDGTVWTNPNAGRDESSATERNR